MNTAEVTAEVNAEVNEEECADDDFVQAPPLKLPRRENSVAAEAEDLKAVEGEPETESENDDDTDAGACPICLEPWTSSGKHRICSLKCGHLFGKICIEKWLAGSNNNGTPRNKCPQCNALARRPDIRVLYTKNIIALDPAEKEELVKTIDDCKADISRYKEIEACLRTEIHMLKAENTKLKAASSSPAGGIGEFLFTKSFALSPMKEACRALVLDPKSRVALVTCTRPDEQHGLAKKSFLDLRSPISFNRFHEKSCRAVSVSSDDEPLVATTGADGKVCISSGITDSVLATFQLPNFLPGWSCCFSPIDSNIIYVGSVNRKIFVFDLREPNDFIKELQVIFDGPPLPIHSLISVKDVLYGASLNGIFRLNPQDDDILAFSQTSSCFSIAYDGSSLLLASFRKGTSTEYSLYGIGNFELLFSVSLSASNTRLVSSCVTLINQETALMAVIDEPSCAVQLWQVNLTSQDGILWQKLPINAPIYAVSFFDNAELVVLSENSLLYFKTNRACS